MAMTAQDILRNADAYRAAYPDYGRWPQPASDPQQQEASC